MRVLYVFYYYCALALTLTHPHSHSQLPNTKKKDVLHVHIHQVYCKQSKNTETLTLRKEALLNKNRILQAHVYVQANFHLSSLGRMQCVALTMLVREAMVSGHLRVLQPQSGTTPTRPISALVRPAVYMPSRLSISAWLGTSGECTSQTPGLMLLLHALSKPLTVLTPSSLDRLDSMVISSASMAAMCSRISPNSE